MKDKVFVDTNLLIYYYSEDEKEKGNRVRDILMSEPVVISSQIVNEFSQVMLKKFKIPPGRIKEILKDWEREFEIKYLTPKLAIEALKIHERYRFSFWDSQVIAAALRGNCKIIYTEDLQHNQMIKNHLRIINPFITG